MNVAEQNNVTLQLTLSTISHLINSQQEEYLPVLTVWLIYISASLILNNQQIIRLFLFKFTTKDKTSCSGYR